MRATATDKRCELSFDSVHDLVNAVMGCDEAVQARGKTMARSPEWVGGVRSMTELAALAKAGLSADGIEAAHIAQDRVQVMDREVPLPGFSTFYDVAGSDVDVARYLSGEPECMINYSMVDTPRVGRVITLVVSVGARQEVEAELIRARGREIVSLIFAIERIGFQVELWADSLSCGYGAYEDSHGRVRVKVKEPGGVLDSGQIMFAFTHPAMFRSLVLGARHLFPYRFKRGLKVGKGYGITVYEPDLDGYPEGSMLIPPIQGNEDPTRLVLATLRKLGLVD